MTIGFVIAAPCSGAGKTTASLALMKALQQKGVRFTPFKAGPDYIDPIWHRFVSGKESYNLDGFMMPPSHLRALLRSADGLAVVEGVGGLFCGGGDNDTAALARTLGLPVLLVVDAAGMAGSIAPLVAGFMQYDARVRIAGVLANRVGSERHAQMLQAALSAHRLAPLFGWMMDDARSRLPERHLGLRLPEKGGQWQVPKLHLLPEFWRWLRSLRPAKATDEDATKPFAHGDLIAGKKIAIARDEAFCFIYPANLEWICAQRGQCVFFSPLAGDEVPAGADALWLPGGYPELHAANMPARALASIREFVESGRFVLAECGGMMVLGQSLVDGDGRRWPMAGLLPFDVVMRHRLVSLGYRQTDDGLRGHEFHYSERLMHAPLPAAFSLAAGDGGVRYKNLRASYCHWYFPSAPKATARLFGG